MEALFTCGSAVEASGSVDLLVLGFEAPVWGQLGDTDLRSLDLGGLYLTSPDLINIRICYSNLINIDIDAM